MPRALFLAVVLVLPGSTEYGADAPRQISIPFAGS